MSFQIDLAPPSEVPALSPLHQSMNDRSNKESFADHTPNKIDFLISAITGSLFVISIIVCNFCVAITDFNDKIAVFHGIDASTVIFGVICVAGIIVRFIKLNNKLHIINPLHLIPNIFNSHWGKFNYFNDNKRKICVYVILMIMVFNIWMHIWQRVEIPQNYLVYDPMFAIEGGYGWRNQFHQFLHSGVRHICVNLSTFFFCIITGEMVFGSSITFIVFWSFFWTIYINDVVPCIGASGSTYFVLHFIWTVNLLHFWLFVREESKNLLQRMLTWLDYASCCSLVPMFHYVCPSIGRSLNTYHQAHASGAIVGMCAGLIMIPIFMFKIHRSRQWRISKMDYIYSAMMLAIGLFVFLIFLCKRSLHQNA